jgi:hypothetical protein
MLQHVRIKLKHGDAHKTGFTTYCIFVILDEPKAIPLKSIQWDVVMPSVASIWEKKDVVQWRICTVQGRNALKIAISRMHDNVACVCFIHIAPNHQCPNFVKSWRIVKPQISATIVHQTKTELNNPALELFRGRLVDVGIGVACMQHRLQ